MQTSSPDREAVTGVTEPRRRRPVAQRGALIAVLVAFVFVRLVGLGVVTGFSMELLYLRDAFVFARGSVPSSPMSPGFGLLLAPVAWAARGDFFVAYIAGSVLVIAMLVAGLVLLHRLLSAYLSPWVALLATAAFAVGQSATLFLRGTHVEPLGFLLVTASLWYLHRERPWPAVVLTGIAVLSRIALAPLLLPLWLVRLRREPRLAVSGTVVVIVGALGHVVKESLAAGDHESYGDILAGTYGAGGVVDSVSGLLGTVTTRSLTYARAVVPALLWPARLLEGAAGPVFAAATLAAMLLGVWTLYRRSRGGSTNLLAIGILAGLILYFGQLMLWPASADEARRFVMPAAAPLILAFGLGLDAGLVRVARTQARRLQIGTLALIALVGMGATASWVAQQDRAPEVDEVLALHHAGAALLPPGAIMSPWPPLTEISSGRHSVAYPRRNDASALSAEARRTGACLFVVGRRRTPSSARAWLDQHDAQTLTRAGSHALLQIEADWCR